MKGRILIVVGSLLLEACREPQATSEEPVLATPSPAPRLAYLVRRVAVATEESLYGLEAGSELKVVEERPDRLLVEAQGVQFEIDRRDATNDRALAEELLARAEEQKTVREVAMATRLRIEDQKFLAEENNRRRDSAGKQVAQLRRTIDAAREELARLEAAQSSPSSATEPGSANDEISGDASPQDNARQQRIAFLQTYIADCDRQIQILSDAMASWEQPAAQGPHP